jgi:metal-sulfur cluster biosynthetic enzyme
MTTSTTDSPELRAALTDAFCHVYDPEFGASIQDLGLIYDLAIDESGGVTVTMTLTSMYCPAGEVILGGIKAAAEGVPGVASAQVNLVWEPAWTPELLTPAARLQLGWDRAAPST